MRIITKKGDVFSVKIDGKYKKYFQYIANDLTQLNSDVIRAFKKSYPLESTPDPSQVVADDVDFYAHCVPKFGVKMGLWEKVGSSKDIGQLETILFRCTSDYGHKAGDEPIRISHNWYVWKIGDEEFTRVGKLHGENRNAFIGLVYNPFGIIELLIGNKNPINYPDFE